MVALLDDIAVLHNQDDIRVANGRETVRDDEACASLHQVIHRTLDQLFCTGIDRTGRFIQDEDAVIGKDSAGNCDQLLLSLRDVAGFLIQLHLIAAG